jgi:two-component sensor histidine kinase
LWFFLLGLLLAALSIAIWIAFSIHTQILARASHEVSTLLALDTLQRSVLDAETGQRGYLLTGKKQYLDPYWNARQRLIRAHSDVDRLIGHSPYAAHPRELDRMLRLINDKMLELDRTVRLEQAGKRTQALAIVDTDLGKRRMDDIRRDIGILIAQTQGRHEAAIDRSRFWNGLLIPLFALLVAAVGLMMFLGLRIEYRRRAAEAEATQASMLRQANHQAELLARELNHRVKNLFSVILAIISLSSRRRPEYREMTGDLAARIRALSLSHSVSQGQNVLEPVSLHDILRQTLAPYASERDGRLSVTGDDVMIHPAKLTPIGLVMHELATNAAKYGALSNDTGHIGISCVREDREGTTLICLNWVETGGPQPVTPEGADADKGFGSTMMDLCVKQLGGSIERQWRDVGISIRLAWPVGSKNDE